MADRPEGGTPGRHVFAGQASPRMSFRQTGAMTLGIPQPVSSHRQRNPLEQTGLPATRSGLNRSGLQAAAHWPRGACAWAAIGLGNTGPASIRKSFKAFLAASAGIKGRTYRGWSAAGRGIYTRCPSASDTAPARWPGTVPEDCAP